MKSDTLGFWIKAAREARGWDFEELAKKVGVHANTIRRVEKGEAISSQTLLAIVDALGGQPKMAASDPDTDQG